MFKFFKNEKKEYNYFTTLSIISRQIIEAVDLFSRNLKNDSFDSLKEMSNELEGIKQSANYQKNGMLDYLYEDFLPPIERRDLIALMYSLEKILKNTADLTIHLDIYQIKIIQPSMVKVTELLLESTHKLPQLMQDLEDFKHPQRIWETLEEINKIKAQATPIYYQGIKNLSLGKMNSFDTMKYTRMYESFAETFQSIENLTDVVEAVIIQNT